VGRGCDHMIHVLGFPPNYSISAY